MKRQGILYVISAPSGAGKTTLLKKVFSLIPDLSFSVSYTTRPKRAGEVEGKDYFFVSKDEFNKLLNQQTFVEHALVHDNFYGTSLRYLKDQLAQGKDIVLDIDTQGAKQIKDKLSAVFIFIVPPSFSVLEKRLRGRKTDSPEVIAKRLANAKGEIACVKNYDYIVINDKIEQAVKELESIIVAKRCEVANYEVDLFLR